MVLNGVNTDLSHLQIVLFKKAQIMCKRTSEPGWPALPLLGLPSLLFQVRGAFRGYASQYVIPRDDYNLELLGGDRASHLGIG